MTPAEGAAVLAAWFDMWNSHAIDRLAELVAPGYVHHAMSGANLDLAGFQQGFRAVLDAFPDVVYTVEHTIVGSDLAAAYLSAVATHGGDYLGIPATGTRITLRGVYHCRIADGLIIEDWDVFDLLTPVFRLGASVTPST